MAPAWGVATLALVLATLAVSVQGYCSDLECTGGNGFYAHPQSCLQYVKCLDGKVFVKKCPANLHYNAGTGMCDKPVNSQCVEAEKEKSKSCALGRPSMLRSATIPGIVCDCGKCCRKPHPTDCTAFYECDESGNAHEKQCSEGLVYNPVSEDCDLPTNYQCPILPECSCKCRYPVEGECDSFYVCYEVGQSVQKDYCTEGLIFNPDAEMCDYPDNVECPPGPLPTNSPTDCKDHKSDCKFWVANGDCVCDPVKSGDCSWQNYVRRSCPASCTRCNGGPTTPVIDGCLINCELGQYWRHPTNCEMFIQCAPYGPQEMPCGPGTRWDQAILTCNHASLTPCVTGNYKDENGESCTGSPIKVTTPEVVKTTTTTKPVDPVTVAPTPAPGIVDGCVINCKLGQYLPHPTNCEMFIQCAPYGPQEMPCGPGTRWDQDILTCNHASLTSCVTGNYQGVDGKDCGGEIKPTSPGTVIPCDLVCPQPNGEFAHPRECRMWVHCSNGIPHVKDCPSTLHFDPTMKACNWPEDTVCFANQDDECIIPIVPCPTKEPVIPPEACDCECCLRPHPEDCQSYYYCDGSNTEFHTCSEGLVFHPVNETCVFAENYPECNPDLPPECECDCLYPSTICTEYYKCIDDKPKKYECPNGLYFNPDTHACDLPANVECTMPFKRSGLLSRRQAPIRPDDCKRLPNGRYPTQNEDHFINCYNKVPFLLKCQTGGKFDSSVAKCVRK